MHPIARARLAQGFSQEALARAVRVSKQSVSNWETGRYRPCATTLLRVARLLRTPADELLPDEEPVEAAG